MPALTSLRTAPRRTMAACGLALGLIGAGLSPAGAESLSIDYDLSLIGLPIGQATLAGNADPGT